MRGVNPPTNGKKRHLLFVCVSNQGRSPFSEFYFRQLISAQDRNLPGCIEVASAGFIHNRLREYVTNLNIPFPEPFYNRPLSQVTRDVLREKGILVPSGWRSKELTPAMVREADLIVTALPYQKEDLVALYREKAGNILTFREVSRQTGYLRLEDPTGLPEDGTYWNHVENDPRYVRTILAEVEKSLKQAFPSIIDRLAM